jgi:hypothetical protein
MLVPPGTNPEWSRIFASGDGSGKGDGNVDIFGGLD